MTLERGSNELCSCFYTTAETGDVPDLTLTP